MTVRHPRVLHRLNLLVIGIGWIAVLAGAVVVLGGWVGGVDALKRGLPGLSAMKANTAIVIALLGAALALRGSDRYRRLGNAATLVAPLLGVVTTAEYVLHWDAGIDQLLFKDLTTPSAAAPGQPAAATVVMISLLAAALLCTELSALVRAKTLAAVVTFLVAWAAVNGYLFGYPALEDVPPFGVALHTAVFMVLLSVGTLAAQPVSWPIRTAVSRGTGGAVCRWLLPPAALVPPLLVWHIQGHRMGLRSIVCRAPAYA